MFLVSLCVLYIGLQIIEYIFGLHWKEFSAGTLTLSIIITISCFINSLMIAGLIWILVSLIEYRNYLIYIKN